MQQPGDGLNDHGFWRPSAGTWLYRESSSGSTITLPSFGVGVPLGFSQGTLAPLPF